MNLLILTGYVHKEPMIGTTKKGNMSINIFLRHETPKWDNPQETHKMFLPVVAFGKTAEKAARQASFGAQLLVQGNLEIYKAKDGSYSPRIMASNVTNIGNASIAVIEEEKTSVLDDGPSFADETDVPY